MPTEIDEVERRIQQLEIEREALKKEKDEASKDRLAAIESRARRPARALVRDEGALAEREGRDRRHQVGQGRARSGRPRGGARRARRRPRARRRAALRPDPRARADGARAGGEARRAPSRRRLDADRGGHRGGHRRGSRQVDRHPGLPPDGGRGREADPHGGAPPRARHRPGRGRRGRLRRPAPLACRALRSRPADRQLPLLRPDRGRQDRARQSARGVHVRLRAGDGPHRHVRVHGEARRGAADRCPARAMSATRRAASSPRPFGADHTP